ncbi:MAG: serpin family protein [Anaerolineae bacterium]|nr:serpin family protein [Anaerolineae bacterium]
MSLAAGNTDFALKLYQQVRGDDDKNMLFSPYSISEALALTYAGARGDTEKQMATTLAFPFGQAELHPAFAQLNKGLIERGNAEDDPNSGQTARSLKIANALWGQKDYAFLKSYTDLVNANYGAGLQLVDYVNAAEQARQQINDWVAQQTNDRIKDIVPPDALSPDTRLVLTNAVYFKNAWQFQFEAEATQDDNFTLLDGSTVKVPMMQQQKTFGYAKGADYQVVVLPYAGGKMSMLVILPDAGKFADVEAKLDTATFTTMTDSANMKYSPIRLFMPRFTFTYTLPLTDKLNGMGMPDAFDPVKADFSGMAEVKPDANLYISSVLHKAFIAVDEAGTEAAAATAVMMGVTSAMPEEPIEVRLDHPFIFAIRDDQTGTILFLGRVTNPKAEQ